ncbi:MAG: sulfatase-like hydrolase/transferase [Planctomycetes bacterium]|nr:sulfatase-like hydrolase/transferase [Planctomycetota bacterium]
MRLSIVLSLVAFTLLAVDTLPAAEKSRPNIVWIMFDDGRADALGCYGRPWAKTPHIDRLARDGVRFRYAIVQNPVCVPSRTSIKTSLYAHQTGRMAMGKPPEVTPAYARRILKDQPCLLDVWTAAGVQPLNVGKVHAFRSKFNHLGDVAQYFTNQGEPTKHVLENLGPKRYPKVQTRLYKWMIGGVVDVKPENMRTTAIGDRAVAAIDRLAKEDDPFFLRVSFHAPHVPNHINPEHLIDPDSIDLPLPSEADLEAKPRFESQVRTYAGADLTHDQIQLARATYYSMVSLVDDQVGRVLEELRKSGLMEDTLIAVTSDQGFQLGENGAWKKRVFYDTNVCVPLIFSFPKALPRGKVIDEPVEMIDFMPTLLALSDLKAPSSARGRSLLPLIRGEVTKWNEACFSEHDYSNDVYSCLREGGGRRVMVRTRKWKLVFFMDERVAQKDGALYDLENDPWEHKNLWAKPEHRDVVVRLEKLAREWGEG